MYYAVTARYTPVGEHSEPTLWPPVCAERGVTFVLFQKHTESPFVIRTTRTVTGAARCTATGDWIPAMAWTAQMEQSFLGAKATARAVPASLRLQSGFVRILAVALPVGVLIAAALVWFATRPNSFQQAEARIAAVAAAPAVGDVVQVQLVRDTAVWYVVRAVTPVEVRVQSADYASTGTTPVPSDFPGSLISIPRAAFLADGFLGAPGPMSVVRNAFPADARNP